MSGIGDADLVRVRSSSPSEAPPMVSSMNTKATRTRKSTLVDLQPLSLAAVHGHVWAESYGQSPVDAVTEARWWRERAERVTVEIPVLG